MNFEVAFNAGFNVSPWSFSFLDEMPDTSTGPGDWPSAGPHHPSRTNRVVQSDQEMHGHFRWRASGNLHLLLNNTCEWICSVYFEQMGSGESRPGNFETVVDLTGGFSNNYVATVKIPAGLSQGIYRVVTAVNLRQKGSNMPLPVAGFEDEGFIQIYNS